MGLGNDDGTGPADLGNDYGGFHDTDTNGEGYATNPWKLQYGSDGKLHNMSPRDQYLISIGQDPYAPSDDGGGDTPAAAPPADGGGGGGGGEGNTLNIPLDKYPTTVTKLPDWATEAGKAFTDKATPFLTGMLDTIMTGLNEPIGFNKVDAEPFAWFDADYDASTPEGQGFLTRALQTAEGVPDALEHGYAMSRGQLMNELVRALDRVGSASRSNLAANGLAAMAPAATPAVFREALDAAASGLSTIETNAANTLASFSPQYLQVATTLANAMADNELAARQQNIDQEMAAAELELEQLVQSGAITAEIGSILASILAASKETRQEDPLAPYRLMMGLV